MVVLRQLEYFVAVARERHFGRAAEACHASQPALSAGIAKLERELGVTLIKRGHNFEGLTPAGKRIANWATRVLEDQQRLEAEAHSLRRGIVGTLHLGVGRYTINAPVARLVASFGSHHPMAKITISTTESTATMARRLHNFELDAAISSFEPDDAVGLSVTPLYEEKYVLLVSEDQVALGDRSISWMQAAELPLVLLTPEMKYRQFIDKTFTNTGAVVDPEVETDSMAALCAHVATGRWASVVPHSLLLGMPPTCGIRAIPLVDPDTGTQISIAVNPGSPNPIAATALVDLAASCELISPLGDTIASWERGHPVNSPDFTLSKTDNGRGPKPVDRQGPLSLPPEHLLQITVPERVVTGERRKPVRTRRPSRPSIRRGWRRPALWRNAVEDPLDVSSRRI